MKKLRKLILSIIFLPITILFSCNGGGTSSTSYKVTVTTDEHVKAYESFPTSIQKKKDLEIKFTVDASYGFNTAVKINNVDSTDYVLATGDEYVSLTINAQYIVGDVAISLTSEYGKLTVSPSTVSIKNYDTHDIYVYDPLGRDINYSTSASAFTVTKISDPVCFRIDSKSNEICSDTELKFTAGDSSITVPVSVYHPKTQQEALDSVTLGFIKGLTDFSVTFDYNNSENLSDFCDHLEITENMSYSYYDNKGLSGNVSTGKGKTNTFSLNGLSAHGRDYATDYTKVESEYYRPVTSANAKIMSKQTSSRSKLKIDSSYQSLTVYNSEELFWAVEHGYYPLFTSSSSSLKAKQIFEKGLKIVKECTIENMDLVTELITIFNVLEDMITYDYNAAGSSAGYPEWLKYPAYFLDGVFLNDGVAVCDGFSKAYAFLCGLDNLPVIRSFGYSNAGGHAWNYAEIDGSWYLICPTWAQNAIDTTTTSFYSRQFSIYDYGSFLVSKNYFYKTGGSSYAFSDDAFPLIKKSSSDYNLNECAYSTFLYNSTKYSFNPKTQNDFIALAKKCEELNLIGTEFYILFDASSLTESTIFSYLNKALNALTKKPNDVSLLSNSDYSSAFWLFK